VHLRLNAIRVRRVEGEDIECRCELAP
jgi:hypothetical protein